MHLFLLIILLLPTLAYTFQVGYLPLDERFTTRNAFLNLAKVTPFDIITPPISIIPSQRQPANSTALFTWTSDAFNTSDAFVMSLEMYLYGGLIGSRISNQSQSNVLERVQDLISFKSLNPNVKIYAGSVVMRIPAYNTVPCTEDNWYWAFYGDDLFTYSYYTSKYIQTKNVSDLQAAQAAEAKIPSNIVKDFLWRRSRNFNVSLSLLDILSGFPSFFETMYITQDDNALYGFNIDEANALRAKALELGLLGTKVLIYPGADEVGLSMLAKMSVDTLSEAAGQLQGSVVPFDVIFRKPDNESLFLVPNYEGQPMILTLFDQIQAAGAYSNLVPTRTIVSPIWKASVEAEPPIHAILLVNNFGIDEYPQKEAPNQITSGRSILDYSMFTSYICGSLNSTTSVISMADNRYSNGADIIAVEYLEALAMNASCLAPSPTTNSNGLGLDRLAFAGWNTDGNTLGTAISNLVLLSLFGDFGPYGNGNSPGIKLMEKVELIAKQKRQQVKNNQFYKVNIDKRKQSRVKTASTSNAYFNVLRFIEDDHYQANIRQLLAIYANQVNNEGSDGLGQDIDFYERFGYKVLASRLSEISSIFGGLDLTLSKVYFPWNRTFEIGLAPYRRTVVGTRPTAGTTRPRGAGRIEGLAASG
jgi:hypothetical protein